MNLLKIRSNSSTVFWAFGIKDRRKKHTENSSFLQDLAWILVWKPNNVNI